MKVLLFSVAVFFFVVIDGEALAITEELFRECEKELGISKGDKDESKFRCMNTCLLKKNGSLQSDGIINTDKVKEMVYRAIGEEQADQFMKRMQECVAEAKSIKDECDSVNAVLKCTNADEISGKI